MSLTVVLGFFFTALTMFLSSTAVVFLGRPVPCLVVSTPVVSFFFRTFQVVVLAMTNAYAMALFNFRSFFQIQNGLPFSHRQLSGLHVGLSFLTRNAVFTRKTEGSNQE